MFFIIMLHNIFWWHTKIFLASEIGYGASS